MSGLYNTRRLCELFKKVLIDYFSYEVPFLQIWSY